MTEVPVLYQFLDGWALMRLGHDSSRTVVKERHRSHSGHPDDTIQAEVI